MKLSRLFFYDDYKGTPFYLKTQFKYELARTILYFAISVSLFIAGIIATGDRLNLLTIVAAVGCLPACKSTIDAFMFYRYKSLDAESVTQILKKTDNLHGLFDRVFTSYDTNYQVDHIVVKGNTICGYAKDKQFKNEGFHKHLTDLLMKDGFTETSIKIFTDLDKYLARLDQLGQLDADEKNTEGIINTLNCISL